MTLFMWLKIIGFRPSGPYWGLFPSILRNISLYKNKSTVLGKSL